MMCNIYRLRSVLEWMEAAHNGADYIGYLEELENGNTVYSDILRRVEAQLKAWIRIELDRGNSQKAKAIRQQIEALTALYI